MVFDGERASVQEHEQDEGQRKRQKQGAGECISGRCFDFPEDDSRCRETDECTQQDFLGGVGTDEYARNGNPGGKQKPQYEDGQLLPWSLSQSCLEDRKAAVDRKGRSGVSTGAAQMPFRNEVAAGQEEELQHQHREKYRAGCENPYTGFAACLAEPESDGHCRNEGQNQTLSAHGGEKGDDMCVMHAKLVGLQAKFSIGCSCRP